MKTVIAIALCLVSTVSSATPVYLKCVTQNTKPGSKAVHYDITLNEDAQTVTVLDDGLTLGKPITFPAQFTQDAVTYKSNIMDFASITMIYRIDRTNLKFTESTYTTDPETPSNVSNGSCKISKPIKRAF